LSSYFSLLISSVYFWPSLITVSSHHFISFSYPFHLLLFFSRQVGNHELWLDRSDYARGDRSSFDKLMSLLELCDTLGVRTRPALLRPVNARTGEVALATPDHLVPNSGV
jgi:hypothetical protein